MRSSYQAEFELHIKINDATIDTELIVNPLDHTGSDWSISYPTCNLAKMELSPTSKISPYAHRRTKATQVNASTVFASSEELQHQMSILNLSTPELIEDLGDSLSSRSNSETSLYETELPSRTPLPIIQACDDFPGNIWTEPSPGRKLEPAIPLRKSSLSARNRNYGTTNLSDLDVSKSSSRLQRQDISPIRSRGSHSRMRTQRSYLAFPPLSTQYEDGPPMSSIRQYHSWSEPQSESQTSLRLRSNTTPPNKGNHIQPSSLNTCKTLYPYSAYASDSGSLSSLLSDTSSTLYSRMPSPYPHHLSKQHTPPPSPHHPPELMEFMSQQSYFFHDDDDEEEETTWFQAQKRKWLQLMHPKSPSQLQEERERGRAGTPHPQRQHIYREYDGGRMGRRKKSILGLKGFFGRGK